MLQNFIEIGPVLNDLGTLFLRPNTVFVGKKAVQVFILYLKISIWPNQKNVFKHPVFEENVAALLNRFKCTNITVITFNSARLFLLLIFVHEDLF